MNDTVSSVIVAGDFCARNMWDKIDRDYSRAALSGIKHILSDADLRIINLENAVIEEGRAIEKSGPPLKALPENCAFLEEGAFECAILANNHVGDYGEEGVFATLGELKKRGIAKVGAGADIEESYKPAYFDLKSGKLAVVAVCENEFGIAEEHIAGTAGFEMNRILHTIREARDNADYVLVIMHGGNEHNPLPSPGVTERYRSFVEFGAHAVIGMHPHCMQGYETYNNAPIIYSTGNFFFYASHPKSPDDPWYYGYLVKLFFSKTAGVTFELLPYKFDMPCTLITPFEGPEKEKVLNYLADISKPIGDPSLLRRYFMGWCMVGGVPYSKAMAYKEEYMEAGPYLTGHPMLSVRNLMTCEAHNELLTVYFKILADGRLETARAMKDELLKLSKMPV